MILTQRAFVVLICLFIPLTIQTLLPITAKAADYHASSENVALVPNASGGSGGAGTMPTSGGDLSQFVFSNLSYANINGTSLANYDTVVLLQVCNIGTALTSTQKSDINNWISSGGKLIIYDSDACSSSVDYRWLIYPFTTDNPGQLGSRNGTLTITEDNTLSSTDPSSTYYVNTGSITANTDAVGDANVMITKDSHWYEDMEATNANLATGSVHSYATFGSGLIIYNGLDTDYISRSTDLFNIWLFELKQPWSPDGLPHNNPVTTDDEDGDGLLDDWEINGIDTNNDGDVDDYEDVDLPRMGADPDVKDIFVEIDYMVSDGLFGYGYHDHQPKPDAIPRIVDAFKKEGINLHVDSGPLSKMNPDDPDAIWGHRSRSSPISETQVLGTAPDGDCDNYDWGSFNSVQSTNFRPERENIFHYAVFAHDLGCSALGLSRGAPESDFIVATGSLWDDGGTEVDQAGIFMHELGHNLGLGHGGPVELAQPEGQVNLDYKPNYLSVMNDSFIKGLVYNGVQGPFDYSQYSLGELDENNLSETVGLTGELTLLSHGTTYWIDALFGHKAITIYDLTGPIDWNGDGEYQQNLVQADINKDGELKTLASYRDWDILVFNGGQIGVGALGSINNMPTDALRCISKEEAELIEVANSVGVAAPDGQNVFPGGSAMYSFELTNLGTSDDSYDLAVKSQYGWDINLSETTIALTAGETTQITATVNAPETVNRGDQDELILSAQSQNNEYISDSARAITTVIVDETSPVVTYTGPTGTVITNDYVSITGTYFDPEPSSGIDQYSVDVNIDMTEDPPPPCEDGICGYGCMQIGSDDSASDGVITTEFMSTCSGSVNVTISIADHAGNIGYAYGSFRVEKPATLDYLFSWYDNIYATNWLLMANQGSDDLKFDVTIGKNKQDLTPFTPPGASCTSGPCAPGEVPPNNTITPIFDSVMGGPVKVSSLTGDKALISSRTLWAGNSLEEVVGMEGERLSDHYYWTWYDQLSAGYTNWVLVANPSDTDTVRAEISIKGQKMVNQLDPARSDYGQTYFDIGPGDNVIPTFPGQMGGPVEVKAYAPGGSWDTDGDRRDVIASQRVLSGGGTAFNEAPGVPAEELSGVYYWPWHDDVGGQNWILLANPNDTPVDYTIDIGGGCASPAAGRKCITGSLLPSGDEAGQDITTLRTGIINGPVTVIANGGDIIASQRVVFGPSFGETMGYRAEDLASNYHWTWYDQQSQGMKNWVLVANPSQDRTIDVEIYMNGQRMHEENDPLKTDKWTLAPGQIVIPRFGTYMGGPVEVRAFNTGTSEPASDYAIASQRVLYNGYFNEVMGAEVE